jgi:hypothetical protein
VKLIYTNDGAIGLNFNPQHKVIWCNNQQEAVDIMWEEFGLRKQLSKEEIAKDVAYAIDHMAKTGDTIAHFGILGSFMYTTTEPEYEF